MNKVYILSIFLLFFFVFMDIKQIQFVRNIEDIIPEEKSKNLWELYWEYKQPFIVIFWYIALVSLGVVWFLLTRDLSEAVGIFLSPAILIFFATQDLLYFLISKDTMSSCMEWADVLFPVKIISDILGQPCPDQISFIISGVFGIILSLTAFVLLKKAKKW